MLSTMFSLVEVENEENVLVCLRVIMDLHKHFKPPFTDEVRCQRCPGHGNKKKKKNITLNVAVLIFK